MQTSSPFIIDSQTQDPNQGHYSIVWPVFFVVWTVAVFVSLFRSKVILDEFEDYIFDNNSAVCGGEYQDTLPRYSVGFHEIQIPELALTNSSDMADMPLPPQYVHIANLTDSNMEILESHVADLTFQPAATESIAIGAAEVTEPNVENNSIDASAADYNSVDSLIAHI